MKDAYFQNISEYDDRESINAYNMMIARGDSRVCFSGITTKITR